MLIRRNEKEDQKRSIAFLTNNIEFEGHVTGFNISGNHDFGVVRINVIRSNVQEFNRSDNDTSFPYRIKGAQAEIYCQINPELKAGDSVRVVSNKQMVYFNPQNSKDQCDLGTITEPLDLMFIQKHTMFK